MTDENCITAIITVAVIRFVNFCQLMYSKWPLFLAEFTLFAIINLNYTDKWCSRNRFRVECNVVLSSSYFCLSCDSTTVMLILVNFG